MTNEEIIDLQEKASDGDQEAIQQLIEYCTSIGDMQTAELYQSMLVNDDECDDEQIEENNEDDDEDDENIILEWAKKYVDGEYSKYSYLQLDEKVDDDPFANFEYGARYYKDKGYQNAVSYFESGLEMLNLCKENDSTINAIREKVMFTLMISSCNLRNTSPQYAEIAFETCQNLLEITDKDGVKAEAYDRLSTAYKYGLGVEQDDFKARQCQMKSNELSVEGCLAEAKTCKQNNDNVGESRWLEKAQMARLLGWGPYGEDTYFLDALNVRLWLSQKTKMNDERVEITIWTLLRVLSIEGFSVYHKMSNFLLDNEIDNVKVIFNNSIGNVKDFKNKECQSLMHYLLSDKYDIYSPDAKNARTFLKEYSKNIDTPELLNLDEAERIYHILKQADEDVDKWVDELKVCKSSLKERIEETERERKEAERVAKERTEQEDNYRSLENEPIKKKSNKLGLILFLIAVILMALFVKPCARKNSSSSSQNNSPENKTVELKDLKPYEESDTTFALADSVNSKTGDTYTDVLVSYNYYPFTDDTYAIYYLNGEYTGLELEATCSEDSSQVGSTIVVYGDDNELYRGNIDNESNSLSANINLENVTYLKLQASQRGVIFTKAALHTNESFAEECLPVEGFKRNLLDVVWMGSDNLATERKITDLQRNTITNAIYHTDYQKESYIEFSNKKEYSSIDGTLYFLLMQKIDSDKAENGCTLNIYGDDELLYSHTIYRKDDPEYFQADISNADIVKITMTINDSKDSIFFTAGYYGWALENVYLRK